jgi:uncharacterized membrane protein
MTAYEWGRLAGWLLFPLVVAGAAYGIGRLATVRLEAVRQRRARRGVTIAAITAGLAVAAINLSPLITLGGDDTSRLSSRFVEAFQKGCQERCMERGGAEARCAAYCGCAAREVARRATGDELRASEIGASLRAKMVEAALFCAKESPPR